MFYDLQGPDDDGSCDQISSQDSCLVRQSILDKSQYYCQWGTDDIGNSSCSYNPPDFSWLTVAYVCVLVSMFTAVVNSPIDAFFELLSSPTADAVKLQAKAANGMVRRVVRRASAVARRVSVGAVNVLNSAVLMAKEKALRATVAGFQSRELPEATKTAHDLAVAAAPSIIARADFIEILLERQRKFSWRRTVVNW